jgi:hypothetical protein
MIVEQYFNNFSFEIFILFSLLRLHSINQLKERLMGVCSMRYICFSLSLFLTSSLPIVW